MRLLLEFELCGVPVAFFFRHNQLVRPLSTILGVLSLASCCISLIWALILFLFDNFTSTPLWAAELPSRMVRLLSYRGSTSPMWGVRILCLGTDPEGTSMLVKTDQWHFFLTRHCRRYTAEAEPSFFQVRINAAIKATPIPAYTTYPSFPPAIRNSVSRIPTFLRNL